MSDGATLPDVKSLLPHGEAMVLLERLVAIDEDSAHAELTVHDDTPWTPAGRVDSMVAIEYMAQTIAAHFGFGCLGRGERIRVGYLVGIREATFDVAHFERGERLSVVAKRVFGERGLAAFDCEVTRGGESLAKAQLSVVLPEARAGAPS